MPSRYSDSGGWIPFQPWRRFTCAIAADFTERWEERTYDLRNLNGVDLFMSYWGLPWIAHTIVSWNFDNGPNLAVSIETRKGIGESYSTVLGLDR